MSSGPDAESPPDPPSHFALLLLRSALPARSAVVRADEARHEGARVTLWREGRIVHSARAEDVVAVEPFGDERAARRRVITHLEEGVGGATMNITEMGVAPRPARRGTARGTGGRGGGIPAESLRVIVED